MLWVRVRNLFLESSCTKYGSHGGDGCCGSPASRTEGELKVSALSGDKSLGLLTDKLLVFNLFGAAANLLSSLLLCHYETSCTIFVPDDIQTALVRVLSLLWAQRCCRA